MTEEKYCKECEETKPITEFYDYRRYGGRVISRCKDCIAGRNKNLYYLRKSDDAKDKITLLRRYARPKRAGSLMGMVRTGLGTADFKTILREVEF